MRYLDASVDDTVGMAVEQRKNRPLCDYVFPRKKRGMQTERERSEKKAEIRKTTNFES